MRMSVTVASLNIRGVPLTGSRLTARCQAIGALFASYPGRCRHSGMRASGGRCLARQETW